MDNGIVMNCGCDELPSAWARPKIIPPEDGAAAYIIPCGVWYTSGEIIELVVVLDVVDDDEDAVVGEGCDLIWFGDNGDEGGDMFVKLGLSVDTKTGIGDSDSISQSLPLSLESPPDMFSFWKKQKSVIIWN